MSNRKKQFVVLAVCVGVLSVIGFLSPVEAEEKTITLQYSSFLPATDQISQVGEQWCREVEKRTNGRVKINFYPGATLTPAAQTYDSVVQGIADIGLAVAGYTRGRFPLSEVLDLPLGVRSALLGSKMYNAYFKEFRPKEYDQVKVLYMFSHGCGIIHSRKPIKQLEDMKGAKIRCNPNISKIVTALGGIPVAMPQTETYDALQKGVVDGSMSPYQVLDGWRFAEVIKFSTENFGSSYTAGFSVVINKKVWESLPKDIQAAFESTSQEWIDKTGNTWDAVDVQGKKVSLDRGNQVITLSAGEDQRWVERVKPIQEDYVKDMKAKGLPGEEALRFCLDFVKANQK